ncbi:hypothetical protein F7725_024564 [Dissostichus mawsoni]|uniref:Transposase Helix-turn-helix domain-containing protein n=1 Tax=Dissostichus mawsoni TaxID=36200 RepID=A0A7J5Y0L8_DISMA|nr:hypothetical protein F7725_024564 [Dissostichus mawsoni]
MQLEIQLEESKAKQSYCRDKYSASQLSEKVLRMETGLPDRDTFSAVCEYVARFEGSITYPEGWFPKALSLEDQVFMTLMKLRHNYTHLHLAALFHCGESTVRNVIVTFIEVLHKLLFKDIMSTVPSREKNKTSLPSSFRHMQNCRMIVDCTDIKIAIPKQMDIQKETYSAYRGMHSFKLLLGLQNAARRVVDLLRSALAEPTSQNHEVQVQVEQVEVGNRQPTIQGQQQSALRNRQQAGTRQRQAVQGQQQQRTPGFPSTAGNTVDQKYGQGFPRPIQIRYHIYLWNHIPKWYHWKGPGCYIKLLDLDPDLESPATSNPGNASPSVLPFRTSCSKIDIKTAGEIMAVSIVKVVLHLTFSEVVLWIHIPGEMDRDSISKEDVTDPELSQLMKRYIVLLLRYSFI